MEALLRLRKTRWKPAPLEGAEHAAKFATPHALHHPLHLGELLQQAVHILHLGA
ncbi:MAG: hypothetical protein RLZZ33_923 [Pseudomonadota bacterium]